jgi:dienelactone hydrolase
MKKLALIMVSASLLAASCATGAGQKSEYDYTEKTAFIQNGDHKIPAIITLPNREKAPLVVMAHGYGSAKDEAGDGYKTTAPVLAKSGIATIRFDYVGNGESTEDYIKFDLNVAVSDADACAQYAIANYPIDKNKVGIMGWSMGGVVTLVAAGRNPLYKSIVTWNGAVDLVNSGVYTDAAYAEAKQNGYALATFDWREPLKLSEKSFEVARNLDVLSEFAKSKAAALAIAGSIDSTVDPKWAKEIAGASKNKVSTFVYIEGADHTFDVFAPEPHPQFNQVIEATLGWFLKTL